MDTVTIYVILHKGRQYEYNFGELYINLFTI